MAILWITEYTHLSTDTAGSSIVVGLEPSQTQTVPIGIASAQSVDLRSSTRFVRVHTDVPCTILFGPNPTADNQSIRLAANQTEFFGVRGGKIAVIQGA